MKESKGVIRKPEEGYQELLDNVNDGIVTTDIVGGITYFNKRFAEMSGYSAEELAGKNFIDIVHPEDRKRVLERYKKRQRGEDIPSIYDIKGLKKSGEVIYVEINTSAIREGKKVIGTRAILRDITEYKQAEETLNIERQQLLSIFDSIDEVIYVSDPETYEILYANQALREAFGDVVGQKCYRALQGMESPCPFCTNELIFGKNTGQPHIWEFQNRVNQRWYRCIDKAIRWPDGRMVRYEMAIDVTERKLVEEELRESEAKYRDLYDNAPDMYHSLDENGIIIDCNETEARMLGYKKEEIIGRPIMDFFTEESKRLFEKQFAELKKEGVQLNLEREFVRKDGTTFPASLNVFAEFDEAGKLVRTKTIARDITERKQAGKALRESEEKYRALVENAFDGINIVDREGNFVFANPEYSRMLGYGPEELIGESFLITLLPEDREAGMRLFKEAINEQIEPYTYEGKNMRKDGSIIDVQSKWNYVYRDGKIVGTMAIARDITERKQAEQEITRYTRALEETGRMKDLFTDIMRHDILNPVMIITGMAELRLYDSPEDEELGTILKSTHRIQDIIDDAATLSTLKDVEELEKEEQDLKEIIDGVCEDFTPALQAAGMKLENKATERMPIKANQILKDVFLNLLSNTAKYASEGKKVVIEAVDEGESYVVAVKDYGPGIPDKDKEDIFERFMRVKKAGVKGTGLGLAIVKKLMELHKGIVWVEDNPEGGSIFYVKIPKSEA